MHEVLPHKYKEYHDEWGTTREGYEDRGHERTIVVRKREGGSVLKSVGSLAIVGGIFWGTYLVAQGSGINSIANTLQENHGPLVIVGLGVVASLLGKYLRL